MAHMSRSMFNKEIVRTITHSWDRFIAIFLIVALGVGFYSGLRMTAPDMRASADQYFDAVNLMDIRVVSTLGLSEADIEAIRDIEGVSQIMPAYETDVVADLNDEPYVMRVHSLPSSKVDKLNELQIVEGRLPEAAGECVLSYDRIMVEPVKIGDTVEVKQGIGELEDTLNTLTYKVVGLVHTPYYASSASMGSSSLGGGIVQQAMYVLPTDFASDFPVTEVFLTVAGAKKLDSSTSAYDDVVAAVSEKLNELALERAPMRTEEVKSEAQQKLDEQIADFEKARVDAYAMLDEAKAKLDAAERQITSSQQQLASGQKQYQSGKDALAAEKSSATSQLDAAQAEIDAKSAQLAKQGQVLADKEAQLADGWRSAAMFGVYPANASAKLAEINQLIDATPPDAPAYQELLTKRATIISLIGGQQALDSGKAQYAAGLEQLNAAQATLNAKKAAAEKGFSEAEQKLDSSEDQLEEGMQKLLSGESDYESGLATYNENLAKTESEFADAQAKLDDAQAKINDIKEAEWLVMDRSKNYGAEGFDMDAGRVDSIARVFPFVFFLVAALVALTTMTRLVDEERLQIGTLKALGYSRARITSKYLIYAALASVLGSIAGILALSYALPAIIMSAYSIVYIVPTGTLSIDIGVALIASGLGVAITLVATTAAALSTLRESPAALMLPPAPKAGKAILLERIRPLWSRLSFLWKVTCRNIFRYKKRLFMTVIGIAGCTALLLTGFGLRDSINDIIDKHYGQIVDYNFVFSKEDGITADEEKTLEDTLSSDGNVEVIAQCDYEAMKSVGASTGATSPVSLTVELIVPKSPAEFEKLWNFRNRQSGQVVDITDSGAVITEKLATRYGVGPGDSLKLAKQDTMGNPTNEVYDIKVAAVIENYVGHCAFLTPDTYETIFGNAPVFNTLYIKVAGDDEARSAFKDKVSSLSGVKTMASSSETINQYKTALKSVDMVVWVLILAAALLAFIVLYNLTNINIAERMREIATLKVLGFTAGEIDKYIFREILLLSIVGALFGLLLGTWLENFVVVTAEVDAVMFGRDIHGPSYAYAFVLTMLFTFIVALTMRHKVRRIDMVESLKSNE